MLSMFRHQENPEITRAKNLREGTKPAIPRNTVTVKSELKICKLT
jgi:hypothetical protein